MHRYIILIWDVSDPAGPEAATLIEERLRRSTMEWTNIAAAPGMLALEVSASSAKHTYCLQGGAGVVVGTLFPKKSTEACNPVGNSLGRAEEALIVANGGRRLINEYWGTYVAVLRDSSTNRACVLRDPSGALACYWTTYRGVRLFFSDINDCAQLALMPMTINWQSVKVMLAGLVLRSAETILNEVSEVRAGECIELQATKVRRSFYWDPVQIAESAVIEDDQEAVARLRDTVRSCINSWAACYPRIIHNLSGGLDSSIVLSCLKQAPSRPEVTCVNYYTPTVEGDERRYARLSAALSGAELIEWSIDGRDVKLEAMLDSPKLMMTACQVNELMYGGFEAELARTRCASAFFQGGGGDGVFMQSGAQHAPADYVHRHGIGSRLLKIACDAAQVTRLSVPSLIGRGIRDGLRRPRRIKELDNLVSSTFLNSDVLAWLHAHEECYIPEPLRRVKTLSTGKRWHIFISSLAPTATWALKQFERPGPVFPLLSQPIHELCLRMPTYLMFHDGWDRAITRRAFKADLPSEIVRRRLKGGADAVMRAIVETNADFIREVLLDGVLVEQGLIDRVKLDAFFSDPMGSPEHASGEVIPLIEIEIFLRRWSNLTWQVTA